MTATSWTRQSNFFTKESSYIVNQFDEKFLQWGKISEITALCLRVGMNTCTFRLRRDSIYTVSNEVHVLDGGLLEAEVHVLA